MLVFHSHKWRYFCWLDNSRMTVIFLQHLEDTLPLSPGFGFCGWENCCQSVILLKVVHFLFFNAFKMFVCFCYLACCFRRVQVWIYFVLLGNCHEYCVLVSMYLSSRKLSLNSPSPLSFLLLPPGLWFDIGTSLSPLSLFLSFVLYVLFLYTTF